MAIDLSQIPVLLGEFLGLSTDAAGLLLTVIAMVGFMMALAILKVGLLGEVLAGTGITALCTVIGWCPIWLIILQIFIIAALFGDKISKLHKSGGD
jgi:hypothetical protein